MQPDGTPVRFAYDPYGRRVSKQYRGQTTHTVWDHDVPLHEWVEGDLTPPSATATEARDAAVESWLQQGTEMRGSIQRPTTWLFHPESFEPMAKLLGDQCWSIVTDQVGVPRMMVDKNGAVTWSARISTYGELRHVEGERNACPFRFQGQYEDAETGLYYNRHRYYDPVGGQYISQDPIGLVGGTALHSYVADPLRFIDPLGLAPECPKRPNERGAAFAPQGKAPDQVTPGTRNVRGEYDSPNRTAPEPYSAHYDEYGRQIGRSDYTDQPDPNTHTNPHHHVREYGPGYGPKGKESGPFPGPHPLDKE